MPELIRVNGEEAPLEVATVAELVASRVAPEARGIAVALNGAVLPKTKWPETHLAAGDRVEIVHARQGG
ncbi:MULTISPECIES: sulfur carrier protein ThiS [unclassified Chelatococcus]|uniref:sulfur carrier protein ThiS n=1 Tax=unclassified Chelatococcus TaxID=2638111 RepID=UPI001BD14D00|nr:MULTISPECIES: sulfur carrier protein ThiS [unclassified Chelatococcus]MBS7699336.1 sulfur carrier protein ThiS [Chelatococcus sp. YT9]MBX3557532.1 sulfur carrier protein ThiS [Chelatococcus sp.]